MTVRSQRNALALKRSALAVCLTAVFGVGGAGASAWQAAEPHALLARALAKPDAAHGTPMFPTGGGGSGVSIPVENCADDGSEGSLRQVVSIAQDGDTVDLSLLTDCPESKITLTDGEIVIENADLTILGPGQDKLTIDGGGTGRVFASKYSLTISDVAVANGFAANGVGGCVALVRNANQTPDLVLVNSTVTGCRAGDGTNATSRGGGVYVGGSLISLNSTISENTATAVDKAYGAGGYAQGYAILNGSLVSENAASADSVYGGGVFAAFASTLQSRVLDNSAYSVNGRAAGGGIASVIAAVTLSTVSGNTAHSVHSSSLGGGVHVTGYGFPPDQYVLLIGTSTVAQNEAISDAANCSSCVSLGGGVSAQEGVIGVGYSLIEGNSASGVSGITAGGGLATYSYADFRVFASTISGNSAINPANAYGGGVATRGGVTVNNSTIAFNGATSSGGGIAARGGAIDSTILANNTAPVGTASDLAPSYPFDPITIDGGHNLIVASSSTTFSTAEPLHADPHLLPLADNGGLTRTHALAPDSPAIDAGEEAGNFDQRFCPFVRLSGTQTDIDAFELQTTTPDYLFGDDFDFGLPPCAPVP